MCGICGILRWDGEPVDSAAIRAMADRMIHRGPDGEGFFIWPPAANGAGGIPAVARGVGASEDTSSLFAAWAPTSNVSVGLGNRRLAVIDPRGGQQPVSNEDGAVTAVYNGEIYNFRELRAKLQAKGHEFRSESDTEVIVHQYEEDGWRCVERFRGMFAFALWDASSHTLLLARDRIGIKPLYYTIQGQRLLFASELWSLIHGLGRSPAFDPVALAQLFVLQYLPAPQTLFPGLYKLPAATVALWRDGQVETIRYWRAPHAGSDGAAPPGRLAGRLPNQLNDATLAEELRRRLDETVAAHLVSDVPVGAFLSGGLDSSLIVACMRRALGGPVHTFAVGFDGMAGEGELEYARQASSAIGTIHQEIVVTPQRFAEALPQAIAALDDPVLDPALVPTLIVSRLARREVTVALTGEGGDELFGGYQRYRLQRWTRLVRLMPRPLRGIILPLVRSWRVRQALEACWMETPAARHLGWVAAGPLSQLRHLCEEPSHFDEAVRLLADRFARLLEEACPASGAAAMLELDRQTWLPDDLLIKVDRMAMAVSLEARVPYLDHGLVEWVAQLPFRMKVRGGTGKYLLKRAAAGLVPEAIVRRRKQGFEPPLAHWLRGPMGTEALERIMTSDIGRMGVWKRRTIEQWFGAHRRGEEDLSLLLWGLWSFALWYDQSVAAGRRFDPAAS